MATVKAVILIGGPSKGTRFRPLSFDMPKPLFPIAGMEMIQHHIDACASLEGLSDVLIIGFYEESSMYNFVAEASKKNNLNIRYLCEPRETLGTAGGLLHFKDEILAGNPDYFFVMNCDICCSFPLREMLEFHKEHAKGSNFTIMGKRVPKDEARGYGCLVEDSTSHELLHYAEKPETFVSNLINCGVYLFTPAIIDEIQRVRNEIESQTLTTPSMVFLSARRKKEFVRLEQDILVGLAGKKRVFVYETKDFWSQIKTAGSAVQCAELYMKQYRKTHPELLAQKDKNGPEIIGEVVIHPTAQVDPSSKIGPNVSIGAGAVVGKGVRIANSIILDGVDIKDHACILYSIIGWNSTIGHWTRVEGTPVYTEPHHVGDKITIFGVGVVAEPEITVRNSIVLPHKTLSESISNEILL